MKWLLLFLVLVNIALFAWLYRPGEPVTDGPAAASSAEETGVASLVLLSEGEQPAPQAPGAQAAAAGQDLACFSIGPFDARALAAQARERLQKVGLDTTPRVDESRQRDAFWVLVPPQPSRTAADRMVATLERKGVHEYFLISAGEEKNGISLGVFSDQSRARAHLREMRRRGVPAVLQSVQLPDRKLWLDGAGPASRREETRAAASPVLDALGGNVRWQARTCPGAR